MLLFSACADEDWSAAEQTINSNMVSFQVTSGITSDMFSEAQSRAADDTTGLLQPLLLKSPEWERPLYLHTYVAEEYERSTGVEAASRSVPVNDMDDFMDVMDETFPVAAWYADTGGEFMPEETEVKPYDGENNVWCTATRYYWPANDRKLRFSAFAPLSKKDLLEDLRITKDEISFTYTVPKSDTDKDAEQQPDLMFAMSECNKSESTEGKAPLNFRHALSAIKFAVRDVVDGTIKKITISGVAGSGSCTYQLGEDATGKDGVFTWSNYSEADASYSQLFDYEVSGITDTPTDENQDKVINDKKPEMTFMLIPQPVPENATIEVEFVREDEESFTLSGNINDNQVTEWEAGKEYIYTISTSSSNWTYHFEVIGCEQDEDDDSFKDSEEFIKVNSKIVSGAYYKVKSYRERANNPNIKETVKWKIDSISKGTTVFPAGLEDYKYHVTEKDLNIAPDIWLPDIDISREGEGSDAFEEHDVTFHPQMVGTDHEGDWDMRGRDVFGSPGAPVDLSMRNGGVGIRNTANCYVINAPGYYKFPLVYGNAITNGKENDKSWKCGYSSEFDGYPVLPIFQNYKGENITGPKIEGAVSAMLVWQDTYNLISDDVRLEEEGGYQYLVFEVKKEDMQQGNAVLAVLDANRTIMWSWHIWITEHWTKEGSLELIEGDEYEAYDEGYEPFHIAPYNLGWCDAKKVWYLKRTGEIKFVQPESGTEKTLKVEQREEEIDYWIGNNVYYQFGRKDPIVGFVNSNSKVKYNFGNLPYRTVPQPKEIKDGIQHPHVLYVGGDPVLNNNDWLTTSYHNLWNNTMITPSGDPFLNIIDYHYSGVKTVYDPSPAGYQVPPVAFFQIITPGKNDAEFNEDDFDGDYYYLDHEGFYRYEVDYKGKIIKLTGTGHRWYAKEGTVVNFDGTLVGAGDNFNPQIVYLWSNQIAANKSAYGLALGNCDGGASSFCFIGRRSMARPVRPVKEFNR